MIVGWKTALAGGGVYKSVPSLFSSLFSPSPPFHHHDLSSSPSSSSSSITVDSYRLDCNCLSSFALRCVIWLQLRWSNSKLALVLLCSTRWVFRSIQCVTSLTVFSSPLLVLPSLFLSPSSFLLPLASLRNLCSCRFQKMVLLALAFFFHDRSGFHRCFSLSSGCLRGVEEEFSVFCFLFVLFCFLHPLPRQQPQPHHPPTKLSPPDRNAPHTTISSPYRIRTTPTAPHPPQGMPDPRAGNRRIALAA